MGRARKKPESVTAVRLSRRRFSEAADLWLEQSTNKIQEKRQNRGREDHGRNRDEHPCVLSLIADISGQPTEPRKPAEVDDEADECQCNSRADNQKAE